MKFRYRKLSGRINEVYGTRKKFAERIGISTVAVSNKMTGKSAFSQKDIERWADALSIEPPEYGSYFFT